LGLASGSLWAGSLGFLAFEFFLSAAVLDHHHYDQGEDDGGYD
jgi:hypothetical protein